jgi:Ras-related GTP-binding protein C/D
VGKYELTGRASSFMDFQVWDLPGHLDYFDPAFDTDNIFEEIGALIWVIDAQDEYLDAIQRLNMTILNLQQSYPDINIEVFVHKVDGLSDDFRGDTFRDIIQRVQDELSDNGYEQAPISFYQTSIYDHSIFEAFSKVIQKLIPQLPTLEALLNNLCGACNIEKAYLFDIMSKIYIATDTSPTDIATYEVCSDYIDVVIDVSEIYGWDRPDELADDSETGNNDAESLITMEKKGSRYLYLREINKSVLHVTRGTNLAKFYLDISHLCASWVRNTQQRKKQSSTIMLACSRQVSSKYSLRATERPRLKFVLPVIDEWRSLEEVMFSYTIAYIM